MSRADGPSLSELIGHLGGGKVDELGSDLVRETIDAVATYPGTKGRLVITLDIEDKGEGVMIDVGFRTKKPYEPIPSTRVWIDNGQLSLFDPDPKVVTFPSPTRPRGGGRGASS